MEIGHWADKKIPANENNEGIKVNSHGYRCREWNPMPDGKKNVVILGCSHTFGVGHPEDTYWVAHLSKHNTKLLRYWNLAVPGCSADKMTRILYGAEKILEPKIIICCWPSSSRRERLEQIPISTMGTDKYNRFETDETDKQNFLKNLFFIEKFAEKNSAKTFHCFADEIREMPKELSVMDYATLKSCWPPWDKHHLPEARRDRITDPNVAQDGIHYGEKHHKAFAELFLSRFAQKLR